VNDGWSSRFRNGSWISHANVLTEPDEMFEVVAFRSYARPDGLVVRATGTMKGTYTPRQWQVVNA